MPSTSTATLQPAAKVPRAAAIAGPQMSADEDEEKETLRFLREDSPVSCDSYYTSDDGGQRYREIPSEIPSEIPPDVLWLLRALEEGRIRRDLPRDARMWSEGDIDALQQAFTPAERGGARFPEPGEIVAVLDRVRDLPDLRPRDSADARWPLP